MSSCLGSEEAFEEDVPVDDQSGVSSGSIEPPVPQDIFQEQQEELEAAAQDQVFEPEAQDCDCSSTSVDPQCEYSFWPATSICTPTGPYHDPDIWAGFGVWANHDDDYDDFVLCAIPSIYPYHVGAHHATIGQVAMYAVNRGDYMYGDIYAGNVFDEYFTQDFVGTLDFPSSSPNVQVDYQSVTWTAGHPFLFIDVMIPVMNGSNYSYVYGFRICYNY